MSAGPLDGLRVLDAGVLLAAPLCGTLLGDFGADVLKIEQPSGDPLRSFGWQEDGESVWWKVVGRNKRSVTLDLSQGVDQDAFVALAATSDVVLESFRPGTLERWDLGYERLAERNPGLILLRTTGFGQTGPYRERPGFGTLAEAMSGFAAITGAEDGPPTLPPIALADGVAALTGAVMILLALQHRNVTGLGQVIDLSSWSPVRSRVHQATVYDRLGVVQERSGNLDAPPLQRAPQPAPAASDDRWIAMSGSSQSTARRVLQLVGGDELADDPRFATNTARVEHVEELDTRIGAWVARHTRDEALSLFEGAQAATGPVLDIAEFVADPHWQEREAVVRYDGVLMQGLIAKLSLSPGQISRPAPARGEHTHEVLREAGLESGADR